MRRILPALWLFCPVLAMAQEPLRFFARPFDVEAGENVVFRYLADDSTVPYSQIKSWRWDFDGDGVWEVQRTVGGGVTSDQIHVSWTAAFDASKGSGDASSRTYVPRLEITRTDDVVIQNALPGITEDLFGLDGIRDPGFFVRAAGAQEDALTISLHGSPRLARSLNGNPGHPDRTREIKIFAEVGFKAGIVGEVLGYSWDFDAPESGEGSYELANASGRDAVVAKIAPDSGGADHIYPAPPNGGRDRHHVAVKVRYRVRTGTDSWGPELWSIPAKKLDFLVIEDVPENLSLGRSYRQGFPERYGWDEVVATYSSTGANGNRYVYFNFLEDAFYEQYNDLRLVPTQLDPHQFNAARNMAETVNELVQGQTLRGLQGMIDALRIRYPRLVDPGTVPERLPAPAGARDEVAELERAALDLGQGIQYAAFAVRGYGPGILRAAPDPAAVPPYPQFPQYLTFEDSTLSGAPIPVKNEYWQLSGAADGQAQARVEKAKLLWRSSLQDATALTEAKEECKVAATQSYLTMALMANGQTETQFAMNEGNSLMAHLRIATDLFDKINNGVNPLGNDGSFIPNESFTAIHQDAIGAVEDARAAEIEARNETRTFDRNQADLRSELLSQRNSYLTPLKLLTGIDPAEYNYLQTVTDQKDYRNTFNSRLNNLEANYPNVSASGLGEYGAQVASIFDAGLNLQDQVTALNNLYENIKISQWANTEVEVVNASATAKLKANDIARGYANGITATAGYGSQGKFWSVSINSGAIISGYLNASDRDIQLLQQARIADIQLEAEIRRSLLQVANQTIAIRRAQAQLDQARLKLESMRAQMDRLIEDLSHTRETAADLYFQDPSFRVSASLAEKRAQSELDYAIDRLYRLAKTLEYEWTEPYRNPILVPAAGQEPPALENPLFDKFTKLDSLFVVRSADEAKDYLDALGAWDSKLRRVNVTSVRGPNHTGPISAVPISVREQILGFDPDPSGGYTMDHSVRDFRNYLENNRRANFYNPENPTLEIRFPIGIEDNTYFPATGSRWNLRLHSVSADLFAESGFSDQQVAEIDLIQSGMVTVRRFFANPPYADDLMKLTFNVDNVNRTVFATAFPARVNGATGGRPLAEFESLGLKGRPAGTTEWILRINTENPANRNIDFSKLKDIVLKMTYTYGNPPEFSGF
jgi:hypothetical protein